MFGLQSLRTKWEARKQGQEEHQLERERAEKKNAVIRMSINALSIAAIAAIGVGWSIKEPALMTAGAVVLLTRFASMMVQDLAALAAIAILTTIVSVFAPMVIIAVLVPIVVLAAIVENVAD